MIADLKINCSRRRQMEKSMKNLYKVHVEAGELKRMGTYNVRRQEVRDANAVLKSLRCIRFS